MTLSLVLIIVMGVLIAAGVYLVLERSLTRVVLGVLLMGNGVNLLMLSMAGPSGLAPIVTDGIEPEQYSDPLPQALILTAIVITFAVSAFLLALIYRSWRLANADDVADDADDVALRGGDVILPMEETAPDEGDTEFPTEPGSEAGPGVDDADGIVIVSDDADASADATTTTITEGDAR